MRSNLKILTQLTKNVKPKKYENKIDKIPKHMRKFSHMKYSKTSIIHYEKRFQNKVDLEDVTKFPVTLPVHKYRVDPKISEVRPPMNDFINFRYMSGNEILLNMRNADYFRHGELCNSVYELSRRINLPANKNMTEYNWEQHEYLKNVIVTTLAFDKLNIKSPTCWLKIEFICDRLIHKLKCRHILTLLKILNNKEVRGTREFSHKLITILPIHTPSLRSKEMVDIIEICHDNNLQAERLINYFLLPKIEKTVENFNFSNYIALLKVMAKVKYQEDPVFWSDFVLPCIFNYELSYEDSKSLWEAYLNVKINCPSLDLAKYFILIENVLNKFEILIKKNQDVSKVKLSIDKDFSLIPKKEQTGMSNIKIKKLQQRISEKEGKENVLRDLGINIDRGSQGSGGSIEGSLNKIMEIKDWKKAKYDFNILELKRIQRGEEIKLEGEEEVKIEDSTVKTIAEEKSENKSEGINNENNIQE